MRVFGRFVLTLRALSELARYDLLNALFGFRGVHRGLSRSKAARQCRREFQSAICDAVERAAVVYWKRAWCLQRSVATARLLRSYGIEAELVIGCRLAPFSSHAWVEVEGKVINGSPELARELQVLERA